MWYSFQQFELQTCAAAWYMVPFIMEPLWNGGLWCFRSSPQKVWSPPAAVVVPRCVPAPLRCVGPWSQRGRAEAKKVKKGKIKWNHQYAVQLYSLETEGCSDLSFSGCFVKPQRCVSSRNRSDEGGGFSGQGDSSSFQETFKLESFRLIVHTHGSRWIVMAHRFPAPLHYWWQSGWKKGLIEACSAQRHWRLYLFFTFH